MRAESIRKYLRGFRIAQRWTTFNGAIQLAVAEPDAFDRERVDTLVGLLQQDATKDLTCVYCAAPAATWDHLHSNVKGGRFSGYGNRIFNLVPACRTCNERKGASHWTTFLARRWPEREHAVARLLSAVEKRNDAECYPWSRIAERHPELAQRYDQLATELRDKIRALDEVAAEIRAKVREDISASRSAEPSAKPI